jgi:phosphoadenosine phosphosulfate reductase
MFDFDLEKELVEIKFQLDSFKAEDRSIFATSSFQTNSVALLHIVSILAPEIPVYMMNTGFLFSETLEFKDKLVKDFGLNVHMLRSETSRLQQRDANGRFLFASDPDTCCHINKIAPLEPIIAKNDVWINGIRGSQSAIRKSMVKIQETKRIVRYHPMLNWTSPMVYAYIEENNLPKHPLEEEGYVSVGCRPCTQRWLDSLDGRGGRWAGQNKTECGLHTTLGS